MSDNSARLNLPFIAPNQAQKHVTHNEALQVLDAVAQMSVVAMDAVTPPAEPTVGDVYALGATPAGAWAGEDNKLAYFTDSGWLFLAPHIGWRSWDQQSGAMYLFDGAAWVPLPSQTQNADGLGIQTSWDSTNRLSVVSAATLLSHAGTGHQLKINKSGTAETASVLFQSNWTGHAEFGLAGETAFSIKVSDDGSAWQTALRIDPAASVIDAALPITGAAVQSSASDTTPGRLMRADYGYGPGNLVGTVSQTAGQPSGAVVETGTSANGTYTRWADGTQMCWNVADAPFSEARRLELDWTFPASFVSGSQPACFASLASDSGVTPAEDELLQPVATTGPMPAHEQSRLRVYRVAGGTDFAAGDALPLHLLAIGRWF